MDTEAIMDLKMKMDEIQKEIDEQYAVMGKELYRSMEAKNHDLSHLRENFDNIKAKLAKIEKLQMDINAMEEEEKQKSAVAAGGCVCPKCHTTYITPVNFCKHCGYNFNEMAHTEEVVCPRCGHTYDSSVHFCKECGYDLTTLNKKEEEPVATTTYVCSKCGAVYDEGYKFCKECGGQVVAQNVTEEEPVEEVEKKPVYVCSKCGAEYEEGYKFCKECGGEIIQK